MLEEWETQLAEFRQRLKGCQQCRTELFPPRSPVDAKRNLQQKDPAKQLEEGTHLLEHAARQILETEHIGTQITSDLASQREVILNTRSNMGLLSNELRTAQTIVKDIFHAYRMNKYRSLLVAIMMALFLLTAFYYLFGSSHALPDNIRKPLELPQPINKEEESMKVVPEERITGEYKPSVDRQEDTRDPPPEG